jgi:16S rRNA (guanine527-N7)-methyltransferase
MSNLANHSGLLQVLGDAQRIGALGSAPLAEIIEHASAFAAALPQSTATCIDLGSGAGIPGLVIAVARPDMTVTLVDRRAKRTDALLRAVRILNLSDRVHVMCSDVNALVSDPLHAAAYDAVCARGFGPPEQTLKWSAALVRPGGSIVVSEPPLGSPDRWAAIDLGALGVGQPQRLGPVAMFHVEQ